MRPRLRLAGALLFLFASACGKDDDNDGGGHHAGGTAGSAMAGEGGVPTGGGEDGGGAGGEAGATGGDAGAPGGAASGGASGTSGDAGAGGAGMAGEAGDAGSGGEAGGEGGVGQGGVGGGAGVGAVSGGAAASAGAGGAAPGGNGGTAGGAGTFAGGTAGVAGSGGGMAGVGGAGAGGNSGAAGQSGGSPAGGAGAGGLGGAGAGAGVAGAGAGGAGAGGTGGWTSVPVTGDSLLARRGHSATLDEIGSRILVFGGQGFYELYADLLSFDFVSSTLTRLTTTGSPPAARLDHVAVLDTVRRRLLVFGGRGYYDLFDDVYAVNVDGAPPVWTRLSPAGGPPPRRQGHVAVFDAVRNRLVVFGGEGLYDLHQDTWELGFATNANGTWRMLAPAGIAPAPRTEAAVAFDASTSRMFVAGGTGFHDVVLDLSVLDLTTADGTWSSQSPAPQAVVGGGLVWDELANRLFQQSGQAYYRLLGGGPELVDAALVYVASEPAAFLVAGQGYHELSATIWRLDL